MSRFVPKVPLPPRAVVIPQNANGYGSPSGQFLSSTTA